MILDVALRCRLTLSCLPVIQMQIDVTNHFVFILPSGEVKKLFTRGINNTNKKRDKENVSGKPPDAHLDFLGSPVCWNAHI